MEPAAVGGHRDHPTVNQDPVGVFDSGVGGLSVLREIRKALPFEDLIYVADSAHAPYGDRPQAFIQARSDAIARVLLAHRAKAIVVACNTATGMAIDTLRASFTVPIVGMEPALKPAVSGTTSGVVGIMATAQTLSSAKFSKLLAQHGAHVEVVLQACPRLVEQVEKGELDTAETRALVESYVRPLLDRGADTIVLGCTHYPFLREAIEAVAGPAVSIIDPAVAVARELRRRLEAAGALSPRTEPGTERVWTSGDPDVVQRVMAGLGYQGTAEALPHDRAE